MTTETKSSMPVVDDITILARAALLGGYTDAIKPNDDVLATRGNVRGLKIYDELERDAKISESLQKRLLALVSRDWKVEPASDSRIDKKAADMVRTQLKDLKFDQVTTQLHDAVMKGISFNEAMWQRDGSEIVVTELLHIEPWLFNFTLTPESDDSTFAHHGVRLVSPQNMLPGDKLPQKKMVIHRVGGKYNNPWGLGLGNKLFWPVFFKRQGISFWLAFAERFGTPVPWGRYPSNSTPQQKSTLKQALLAFTQEGAIMTPIGMEIELVEAARSGIDTYEKLSCYMDDQITGIVLGKSGGRGSGGQLAAAINVENEVRLELVKADADLISDTLNTQLIPWIVDYNLPGAGYPKVSRVIEEPVDKEALASTFKTIFDMGYQPSPQLIEDNFGTGWEMKPQSKVTAGDTQKPVAFAAEDLPTDQLMVDAFIENLGIVLDPISKGAVQVIFSAVNKSVSHADALHALTEIAPDVPLEDLQTALARALFVADTFGRLSVQNEQA